MAKLVSDWHETMQKEAEPEWDKRLDVLGIDKVRFLILNSDSDETIGIPNPIIAVNPETKLRTEFRPSLEYAINWVDNKIEADQLWKKREQENTLKIQRAALTISALGALATIANVIRLFLE